MSSLTLGESYAASPLRLSLAVTAVFGRVALSASSINGDSQSPPVTGGG